MLVWGGKRRKSREFVGFYAFCESAIFQISSALSQFISLSEDCQGEKRNILRIRIYVVFSSNGDDDDDDDDEDDDNDDDYNDGDDQIYWWW